MTAPEWDATMHPRVDDGTFTDKRQSMPEVGLNVDDDYEENERDYTPSFRIPVHKLELALKKIDQANAKLKRLGIEERFVCTSELETTRREGRTYEFARLTLNRPTIGFDGWTFTGAHDFTPAGHVLNFRTTADAPEVVDNHCDHCGSKRARSKVYTVVHPEKGTMQIGASCLEAFLGMSPKGLWALTSELELDDIERESGDLDVRSQVYAPEDLIVAALAASNDGADYVTASQGSFVTPPTAVTVAQDFEKLLATGDTKERAILARKVLRWVRKLEGPSGGYNSNLLAVFAGKKEEVWVRKRNLGLAVSVVSAYHRAQSNEKIARAVEKQKIIEKREFLAAPDAKVENLTATVQLVSSGSSYYGGREKTTTWLVMMTDEGHVLTWNASSDLPFNRGDRVAISKATVKGNEVYRDTFQTNLTRAKITSLED